MLLLELYGLILYVLHNIYFVAHFLHKSCMYVAKLLSTDKYKIDDLYTEIKSIRKKPHHLVFILANEEPSYKDLANIVLWSVAAGIPIISFYDYTGILKHTKSCLYDILHEKNIKFTADTSSKLQNGYHQKNGFINPQTPIRVNIISLEDGQRSVVEVTKDCIKNNVKLTDIDIGYVDKKLKYKLDDLPDPELALYCGHVCSTYGVMPWQIRNTEFIDIITHKSICLSNFILALQRYEKSEQRFGK